MNKLIINTANENLIIVLQKDEKVFFSSDDFAKHHNEVMLSEIDALLKENNLKINDIDEFGVVVGPGSFTGIRVGIATIKAFRDALKVKAKSINNLQFLFKLASKQYNLDTVAIFGSKNSYFVAKKINNIIYKYPRNLTKDELVELAENKPIGVFKYDENLNCKVVKFDADVLLDCYNESADFALTPVYYQLSQAESEKLKKGNIEITDCYDCEKIFKLQKDNIIAGVMSKDVFISACKNENYKILACKFNDEIVGYVMILFTDEISIESIAVDKNYRNIGIATALINSVIDVAKSKNIHTISLEVSKNNITAYLLYKKLGFTIRRIRKNYYQDNSDCYEMVLIV